jgi:16S rRNA (guanine527-N7)-methyltransferase
MAFGQPEFVSELKALGINVSRETLQRLETYAGLLVKWQAKINLVGPATLPDLWRRHFLDSAQLLPLLGGPIFPHDDSLPPLNAPLSPLRGKVGKEGDAAPSESDQASGEGRALRRGPPLSTSAKLAPLAKPPYPSPARGAGEKVLVDLGSGAGFPGLVLAIMTDWTVHLLDSDQRKCAFLRQVALDCGVLDRVTIRAKRIEQVTGIAADVVTARACAPLGELFALAEPFIGEKGTGLFLKGAQAEEELTQAQRHWTMRLDRRESISDPAGKILIVSHLKRKSQ